MKNFTMIDFSNLEMPGVSGVLEICIIALAYYYLFYFLRGTRGAQVLTGFVGVIVLLFLLTRFLNLDILNWLLKQFSPYFLIAFLILFHPEIRRGLAELGRKNVFSSIINRKTLVDALVKSTVQLADRKIGALIAVERKIGTRLIEENGHRIDAVVSPELLSSIFFPRSPLHDGGVIIRNDRIVAAGCVFPLSHRESLSKSLGTRHRAAIGFTEESDALVLVVSEETGTISLAFNGKLSRGLDETRLRRLLTSILIRNPRSQAEGKEESLTPLAEEK